MPDLTNSDEGFLGDSWKSGKGQHRTTVVPLRKQPKDGYYFQDNELIDLYASIIGPFATAVYGALCRNTYGKPTVKYSVRDLARTIGMSATIAARSIEVLENVGLIERLPTSGNQKSVCQLFDLKALALFHGATRERKSAPLQLPTSIADRLKARVKTIRQRQQGKEKQCALPSGKDVGIASRSRFNPLFSVSQRDASVSHLMNHCSSRDTQTGTHLLQEELRNKEVPTPTPTPIDRGQVEKDNDLPVEDEPGSAAAMGADQIHGSHERDRQPSFRHQPTSSSTPCQRCSRLG